MSDNQTTMIVFAIFKADGGNLDDSINLDQNLSQVERLTTKGLVRTSFQVPFSTT